MKKLTTRGLQALAGGPSKLRSVRTTTTSGDVAPPSANPALASTPEPSSEPLLPLPAPPPAVAKPLPEAARAYMDSALDITLPRGGRAEIAIANLDEPSPNDEPTV